MRLQRGFTLTEVLVTLLVLNIGLLGVLAGQTLALKQVRDALYRTQAVALSSALLNEVQSNTALLALIGPRLHLQTELPVAPVCTLTSECTDSQLAAMQLQQWFSSLKPHTRVALPDAEFCLQQLAGTLSLNVSWRSASRPNAGQVTACQPGVGRSAFAVSAG